MNLYFMIAAAVLFAAANAASYFKGVSNGENSIQVKWDAEKLKNESDATMVRKEVADEGYKIAVEYESQLNILKGQHERLRLQRATVLREKIECPSSGQAGDLVVPAAVVRSMFNVTSPASAPTIAAGASSPAELARALRTRPPSP